MLVVGGEGQRVVLRLLLLLRELLLEQLLLDGQLLLCNQLLLCGLHECLCRLLQGEGLLRCVHCTWCHRWRPPIRLLLQHTSAPAMQPVKLLLLCIFMHWLHPVAGGCDRLRAL